jgi:hypothetical protein
VDGWKVWRKRELKNESGDETSIRPSKKGRGEEVGKEWRRRDRNEEKRKGKNREENG